MHLVFYTRGIKQEVDTFVKFMETTMFRRTKKDLKTGEIKEELIQGQLRPFQLWEFIFPEEHKDLVCTSLNMDENGKVHPFTAALNTKLLQKAMGLQPVKFKKTETKLFLPRNNVALYPVGIKKDVIAKWEDVGYELEML